MPDITKKQPTLVNRSRGGSAQEDYPLSVLLYSHDSVGLGHLRRNLAIAGEIERIFPRSCCLIVTGSPCATQFKLPSNTEVIKIPCVTKDGEGNYVTKSFSGNLERTLEFRARMLLDTFLSFSPELVIMDHQLTGLYGEALDMLRAARKADALIFFGLRDIKDSPEVLKSRWNNPLSRWALNELYDHVCIYGMQSVYDPVKACAPLFDHVRQHEFTGFIVPPHKQSGKTRWHGTRKKVLVTFGGGSDGIERAETYLDSLEGTQPHWDSHIITGPLMAPAAVRRIRARARKLQPISSVRIHRFHGNLPGLLRRADAVVSMAGYNTCAEILQSGIPAVLLPRTFPRKEQLIRATRLAELGWVKTLPAENPDPRELFDAVESALASGRRKPAEADLNGLRRLGEIIVAELQALGRLERAQRSLPTTSGFS